MAARSFTQWSVYDGCPRQFKYRYRDRIPVTRVKSEAATRGTRIHESIEHYMDGSREDLDPEIHDNYFEFVENLKANFEHTPELRFAINKKWEPCGYKDEDCLVRGFIDLVVIPDPKRINAFEWKSGKVYDEHLHQKMLYGMVLLILYPEANDVTVTGVYLDSQENKAVTYRREMLGTYKWMWDRRFTMMEADEVCAPNPSWKCKWCDYSKSNGGPCGF